MAISGFPNSVLTLRLYLILLFQSSFATRSSIFDFDLIACIIFLLCSGVILSTIIRTSKLYQKCIMPLKRILFGKSNEKIATCCLKKHLNYTNVRICPFYF